MVVLNEFLPISITSLKIHLSNKIREILDDRLDYFIETSTIIRKSKKNSIFDNIIKDIKNVISSDHFLYLVMHDNYCVHKYKKGKNEGQYCAKKIRSNNPKKAYLCCQHDKDHIPKKKQIRKNADIEKKIEMKNTYNKKENKKSEIIEKLIIQENQLKESLYIDHNYNNDNKKSKKEDTNIKIYSNSILTNIDIPICNPQKNINIEKKDKIIKFNKNNKKNLKKSKWKKLDILKDTGFIFT